MTTTTEMIARQQPLSTEFGYRSTAAEAIAGHDLAGARAIVTGGYSGLGLETVRALARAGVSVIVPARRPDVAADALRDLEGVEVRHMDLSDLDSVAAFTATIREDARPLRLVINAAGVMATPQQRTPQGWEWQFGTNHLGHFALVGGVAPLLAEGSRVISYSSVGHYRSPVLFDDITFETTPYDPWVAYGQSKTANALFAGGLDARGSSRGIHSFSVHPGAIMTPLLRHLSRDEQIASGTIDEAGNPINPRFKSPEAGAATQVWAATASLLDGKGGVYLEDCEVAVPWTEDLEFSGVKDWATDPEQAARLWDVSAELTGVDAFA